MRESGRPPFEDLTETTGIPVSREGAEMMYTRYRVAADLARGKRVLELGCGAGQGFGLVGREARHLVGGDVSLALLRGGRRHYHDRFPFVHLSAEQLPFREGTFDLVLFFEASYYVPDMDSAFREIARVLRPDGTALFVNANPERPDFIRSPHSVHYHTGDEFRKALAELGLSVTVQGAFPTGTRADGGPRVVSRVAALARRALDALGLVPRTLRGRARLKRLALGKLLTVPSELPDGFAHVAARYPATDGPVLGYKILYVAARKGT